MRIIAVLSWLFVSILVLSALSLAAESDMDRLLYLLSENGWYLQAGYFFIPKKLQGILKYDTYDSNKKASKHAIDVYTIGANWFFDKWAKLQVNYELKDEEGKEKKQCLTCPIAVGLLGKHKK